MAGILKQVLDQPQEERILWYDVRSIPFCGPYTYKCGRHILDSTAVSVVYRLQYYLFCLHIYTLLPIVVWS